MKLEQQDCTIYLNYALVLFNNGLIEPSKQMFERSEKIFETTMRDVTRGDSATLGHRLHQGEHST